MKVLFAVSTENIAERIIKTYQKEYKEIISSKNVYYFNAIIKELQRNQTYDRIVISEDLEPFTNNNYEAIDKFIFEKLDRISDEAISVEGKDIPIVVICSERREKADNLLVKLFSIGVYDALVGNDRSIEKVCNLLKKPRTKKEAKTYYKIEQGEYEGGEQRNVSEIEIQNILSHYRRLGKNEGRYVESFDSIAEQYNDEQLKIIINFLPMEVKAVLEASSPKYQSIMTYNKPTNVIKKDEPKKSALNVSKIVNNHSKKMDGPVIIPSAVKTTSVRKISAKDVEEKGKELEAKPEIKSVQPVQQRKQEIIERKSEVEEKSTVSAHENVEKVPMTRKAEIKGQEKKSERENLKTIEKVSAIKKVETEKQKEIEKENLVKEDDTNSVFDELDNIEVVESITPIEPKETQLEQPVKRGRGRPRKNPIVEPIVEEVEEEENSIEEILPVAEEENKTQRISKKDDTGLPGFEDDEDDDTGLPGFEDDEEDDDTGLPGFEDNEDDDTGLPGFENDEDDDTGLPGFEDEEDDTGLPGFEDKDEEDDDTGLPGFEDKDEEDDDTGLPGFKDEDIEDYGISNSSVRRPVNTITDMEEEETYTLESTRRLQKIQEEEKAIDISYLLTQDKKMVAFVGTSKNGVSFLVNNVAEILSNRGIKTAIVDLTKNKNSYYIYTENKEDLREVAYASMENLKQGKAIGIEVNKNLTVYTSSPNIRNTSYSIESMLTTLAKNYSLVLLDCDYSTNKEYFRAAQEIYLVQSMDVLTIQPLTEFLRRLKLKDVLQPDKLRAVINKALKVKNLNEELIVGGMSTYNDPEMSIQDRLFDMKNIKTMVIPFDIDAYSSYMSGIANCDISTKGYNKTFLGYLTRLADQVYPQISNAGLKKKDKTTKKYNNYEPEKTTFSKGMNDTLNQMKKQYK